MDDCITRDSVVPYANYENIIGKRRYLAHLAAVSSMSLPDIPDSQLNSAIAGSLETVFQTMLRMECEICGVDDVSVGKVPVPDLGGEEMAMVYVGSVGFVGSVHGIVYLYMKSSFAEQAAERMTSIEEDDLDHDMVTDVCGELTNMFGGAFKNKLADFGYPSTLTIPTVLSGDELYISTLGVVRHIRHNFKSGGNEIVADLVLAEPVAASA